MNTPTKHTRPPFRSRPPFKRPDSLTILADRLKKLEISNAESKTSIAGLLSYIKYLEQRIETLELTEQLLK